MGSNKYPLVDCRPGVIAYLGTPSQTSMIHKQVENDLRSRDSSALEHPIVILGVGEIWGTQVVQFATLTSFGGKSFEENFEAWRQESEKADYFAIQHGDAAPGLVRVLELEGSASLQKASYICTKRVWYAEQAALKAYSGATRQLTPAALEKLKKAAHEKAYTFTGKFWKSPAKGERSDPSSWWKSQGAVYNEQAVAAASGQERSSFHSNNWRSAAPTIKGLPLKAAKSTKPANLFAGPMGTKVSSSASLPTPPPSPIKVSAAGKRYVLPQNRQAA